MIVASLSSLPVEQLQLLGQDLDGLDHVISVIAAQDFSKYFIWSVVMTILAVISGLIFLCSLWHEAFSLTCHVFGIAIPTVEVLRVFSSFVCVVALLIPGIYMRVLLTKCSELPFDVKQGGVQNFTIGALALAAIMLALTTITWIVQRCLQLKHRS